MVTNRILRVLVVAFTLVAAHAATAGTNEAFHASFVKAYDSAVARLGARVEVAQRDIAEGAAFATLPAGEAKADDATIALLAEDQALRALAGNVLGTVSARTPAAAPAATTVACSDHKCSDSKCTCSDHKCDGAQQVACSDHKCSDAKCTCSDHKCNGVQQTACSDSKCSDAKCTCSDHKCSDSKCHRVANAGAVASTPRG